MAVYFNNASVGRLFLEWILQNKAGHLMVFTQCSILNRDSHDVDENRRSRHLLGRELPFWGFSTDLHYLGLSTALKRISLSSAVMANSLTYVKNYHFTQLSLLDWSNGCGQKNEANDLGSRRTLLCLIFFYRSK